VQVTLHAIDPDDAVPPITSTASTTTYYGIDQSSCVPATPENCQTYAGSPVSLSGDGAHTLSYFSMDQAGNAEVSHQLTIPIDTMAPTAPTASFTPASAYTDGSGHQWFKDSVTVSYGGSTDPSPGSGLDATTYSAPQTVNSTGSVQYSGTVQDVAGNTSPATSGTVYVDASAPVVSFSSCPTSVGYQAVASAAWTASDQGAGLASASSGTLTLPTSSVGQQTVTAPTATDNVGHTSTTATCSYTVTPAPLTITANDQTMLLHGSIPTLTASYSGFVNGETAAVLTPGPTCSTTATSNSAVGTYPITCSGAVDPTYVLSYLPGTLTVHYQWSGFSQPLNDPVAGATPMSVFKAGSTVAVKFQLTDATGAVVQAGSLPTFSVSAPQACAAGTVDESVSTATGDTSPTYRWDSAAQQYIYNYKTASSLAGMCQSIKATLDDGTTQSVLVGYK
jgi:hypothetical protein